MRVLDEHFPRLSEIAVAVSGHRVAIALGGAVAVSWTAVGITVGFPTWWFLYANMIGTLVTVLILLLIQHSQNRDMQAVQIKVDELIRSSEAGNHLIGLHERAPEDADALMENRRGPQT